MEGSQRAIFRDSALQRYMHSRRRDILPRLIFPGYVIFLWVLLAVFLIALIIVFWGFQRVFGV